MLKKVKTMWKCRNLKKRIKELDKHIANVDEVCDHVRQAVLQLEEIDFPKINVDCIISDRIEKIGKIK